MREAAAAIPITRAADPSQPPQLLHVRRQDALARPHGAGPPPPQRSAREVSLAPLDLPTMASSQCSPRRRTGTSGGSRARGRGCRALAEGDGEGGRSDPLNGRPLAPWSSSPLGSAREEATRRRWRE